MIRKLVTSDVNVVPADRNAGEGGSERPPGHARPWESGAGARWGARVGAVAAAITLMLASSAMAASFPLFPEGFSSELVHFKNPTAESSWGEILKWGGIEVAFPMLPFGNRFVPIQHLCVAGDELRIADPRVDNGVRVSADGFRAQARAAWDERSHEPVVMFAAASSDMASLGGGIQYPVAVYRVLGRNVTEYYFLFEKSWNVPVCTPR
jgi:hypothetical protein